ncbi:putative transposase [Desulfonatronum thiosulfatophilum]|uniref:Putative transposase n=1 Tax=Desulfonatronum thiosulfatophilum TaxID=617002 RepID=A0A1G6A4P3_9BACT|nr:Mu transposase C-terminal domain-containing protein [Desulfonatronum thiosulfatophilum]SDB03404.1 putative transposase [Desulfonatronum thiosulfatophilum]
MKATYAAADIAQAMGISKRRVNEMANEGKWPFEKRQGRGGGRVYPYKGLPHDVREKIQAHLLSNPSAVPAVVEREFLPVVQDSRTDLLTNWQREVMTSRMVFVRHIERLEAGGLTRNTVIESLVSAAKSGNLREPLSLHLERAVVGGEDGKSGRKLSKATLYRWVGGYHAGGEIELAPAYAPKPKTFPAWGHDFLAIYQRPSKPSLADAHREFAAGWTGTGPCPNYHAVRRFVCSLSTLAREKGRKTGNAYLGLLPYVRRKTDELWPCDVYTMDGTTFDAEIQHPDHGQPFKPEITLVIDVATRRCVGVSVSLAESAMSTLDALRMACVGAGLPAMVYADRGSGYTNAIWSEMGTGMAARLGYELTHSRARCPQGKGLMERAGKSIWVPAAKRLFSCSHADMDRDAAKKVFKFSRDALKKTGRAALPTWQEFKEVLMAVVREYNARPHSALPKIRIEDGRMRRMSPDQAWADAVNKGWKPDHVTESQRAEMFMPSEKRKVRRGLVQFYGGSYFHKDLEELHGEIVDVRYDMWDVEKVYVYTLAGLRVCVAELDGHAQPYFPKARIDAARDRRQQGQLMRLEAKAQRIAPGAMLTLPEDDGVLVECGDILGRQTPEALTAQADGVIIDVSVQEQPAAEERRPLFQDGMHRYRWLMTHRERCTAQDEEWLANYARTDEYADMAERYEFDGIGYKGQAHVHAAQM